jgi:hypothetical protein
VHHSCDAEKLVLSFDGGDSGRKNSNKAESFGSAFGGSLESGGQFCVDAFGKYLTSVAMKIFPHLIYLIKIF